MTARKSTARESRKDARERLDYMTYMIIERHPGISIMEVQLCMGFDKHSVLRCLDRMEWRGYVTRNFTPSAAQIKVPKYFYTVVKSKRPPKPERYDEMKLYTAEELRAYNPNITPEQIKAVQSGIKYANDLLDKAK